MLVNGDTAEQPGLIKDTSTQGFRQDVIAESMKQPVLVDFWAPWCGPCKQLTPVIEKVVKAARGKVRLVKMNIDEFPEIPGQLGIQSIPAVFAFAGGRPVDAFMGAIPESEVRRFADKVIAAAPAGVPQTGSLEEEIKHALEGAAEALKLGDLNQAAQIYGMILQQKPDHAEALIGIAKVFFTAGQPDQAQAALEDVPEADRKGADYISLVASIKLLTEAAELSETDELAAQVAANPDDHQARFDLAVKYNAEGKRVEAAETLVALMKRDRTWNEDGARKKLLELFEAWGGKDPATLKGRRLLSAVLFS